MKSLLEQDDCAPDAYEWFSREFFAMFGESVKDFKSSADRVELDDGMIVQYQKADIILEISGDAPWYRVFKTDAKNVEGVK